MWPPGFERCEQFVDRVPVRVGPEQQITVPADERVGRITCKTGKRRIDVDDLRPPSAFAVRLHDDDAVLRMNDHRAEHLAGPGLVSQFDRIAGKRGKVLEQAHIGLAEPIVRPGIEHRKGTDGMTVIRDNRRACVEANERRADDQRVVGETRLARGVEDDSGLPAFDRMSAERDVALRLRNCQAHAGLEPLPSFVDERQDGHGTAKRSDGEPRQGIEGALGRRVEQSVAPQRIEARPLDRFIFRFRHWRSPPRGVRRARRGETGRDVHPCKRRRPCHHATPTSPMAAKVLVYRPRAMLPGFCRGRGSGVWLPLKAGRSG